MSASHPNNAIILIDPYNDFLHPEGKMYSALEASLREADTLRHLQALVAAAREERIPIYFGLHQQYKPGTFDGWKHMKVLHHSQKTNKVFEEGSWGAEIFAGMEPILENGDVVFSKHWSSSSFQNTDLDYLLRQREITSVVIAGLTANACVEATARYAYDLGYEVTLLSDATAGFSIEQKKVATDIIWPLFATKVTTTDEYIASLKK